MATVGQVSNERWYLARKYRLAANKFGLIISACKRNRYPESLFETLFGSYNLDGIKSIQWGRHHEKDGLNYLKENHQLEVKPTGIWLTCSGLLGASPDGLVGDDAIVEEVDDNYATCNLCTTKLSYKTSTTNLKRHLQIKHPTVSLSHGSSTTNRHEVTEETVEREPSTNSDNDNNNTTAISVLSTSQGQNANTTSSNP
ncbi:unnamed protein product [Ceutorhynchus assimilis]|uniref:BED-type domain-containing protein n=1 Tax=Ceutorhynchus assimilis TaxID=467358 RepID=A0A9N9MJK4_9CUCU|nr:unnamed protein product [Ceutorhynchus assimilis]